MVSTDPCLLEFIPCVVSSHTVTGLICETSRDRRSKGTNFLKGVFIYRLCPPLSPSLTVSLSLPLSSILLSLVIAHFEKAQGEVRSPSPPPMAMRVSLKVDLSTSVKSSETVVLANKLTTASREALSQNPQLGHARILNTRKLLW